jgi:hypothetical protein
LDIILVGNGCGLYNTGRGYRIDRDYDEVVRFGVRRLQPPDHFGIRVDYIVTSTRNHSDVINEGIVPKQTWVFCRPGQVKKGSDEEKMYFERLAEFNPVICYETWRWAIRFNKMGATGYIDPRQGKPGLLPSFSQGTAGIIIAAERLKPKSITLAGFDNWWAGDSDVFDNTNRRYWGIQPGPTLHDYATERKLGSVLAAHYGFKLVQFI